MELKRAGCLALASFTFTVAIPALGQAQTVGASDRQMEISRAGSQPSVSGPAGNFTGSARIDPLFTAKAPSRVAAGSVTFEPGARSAWHSHPLGQHLLVTSGLGWTQVKGGPILVMRPGDVIWCPPGVKHWHGASPTTSVTHIAIQEVLDGRNVEWMEKVTDEQYSRGPGRD